MVISIINYALFSFIILFLCSKISYKLNLVDLPDNRKIHYNATAFTGGIGISTSLIIANLLFEIPNENLNLIISMALLMSIIGLIDDKFHLNVGGKLSLQIFPIFYLIVFENLALTQLGDYYYFKLDVGSFSVPLTILCSLFLINAFNYFDGADGTLSVTSISVLGILYFLISDQEFQLFLLILLIPICIFLFFNFSFLKLPKMFLGDSGSLLLGFIISFFLIYLANRELTHPILLAWTIVIYVYEFLSINIIRLQNNQNPFKAGQDHLHHIILYKTKSILFTNFFITTLNLVLFLIGYLSFLIVSSLASLVLFITFFIIFLLLRNRYAK